MAFKILDKIGVVLGDNKVNSEYFANQADETQRASLLHYFKDIVAKETRYLATDEQTSASLACEAAKKALEENHISGKSIDMVICVTQTPEYTSPTVARYVVEEIDGREDIRYLDMQQNCTGMLAALDLMDQYFRSDSGIERALIVQGDTYNRINMETTSPFFGLFSDIGCAIVLEKSETSCIKKRNFKLLKNGLESIVYPKDGTSKPNQVLYTVPGLDAYIETGIQVITDKLTSEELKQIKVFCISQFALENNEHFAEILQIPEEKIPYVGAKYGYTGSSSPILALNEAIQKGMIQRGDSIILCTYGSGIQYSMLEIVY